MVDEHEGQHSGPQRSSAALWERVETQGRDIRNLSEETASQFRDFRAEVNTALGGVVASVEKLGNRFEVNAAAQADRQRPQYLGLFGAMIAAVGLSITITQTLTGLHDKPVDQKLADLGTAISDLNKNTAAQIGDLVKNTSASFGEAARNTVSQREFQQTLDFRQKLQDLTTAFRDKQIANVEARLDRVQTEVVPRAEFTVRLQAETDADNRLQHELDEALRHVDERQHEIELRYFNAKPVQ